jgi:hypothetical protein
MLAAPTLRATALTLAVDLATAELFATLEEEQLPGLLLRGPAVARRYYGAAPRPYLDVDLLVAPASRGAVCALLARLGFRPITTHEELAGHRPVHANEWRRSADNVSVDLHRTVSGIGADDDDAWRELAARADVEVVAGQACAIPDAVAAALIVALHAAHNGPRAAKPLADLARALDCTDAATWRDVAALAGRVDATAALAAGLRLLPAGSAVAVTLALPEVLPVETVLRAAGPPPLALGLDWLSRTRGIRSKSALVTSVVVPRPGPLRSWRPLARRGRLGLAAAYVSQPLWLARHAIPSLAALRRARREAT